jgi:hypothetical protein
MQMSPVPVEHVQRSNLSDPAQLKPIINNNIADQKPTVILNQNTFLVQPQPNVFYHTLSPANGIQQTIPVCTNTVPQVVQTPLQQKHDPAIIRKKPKITKSVNNKVLAVQSMGQIHVPADQMKQVCLFIYVSKVGKLIKGNNVLLIFR